MAQRSRLILNLRAADLMLALLAGLEALRRYQSTRQQLTRQQDEQLQTLQALVRDNKRPLTDWAAWDEVLAFSEGRQPDFVEQLMRTTALLDGGAVMAIHDGAGRQLTLEGVDRQDRSGASLLVRCLDQVGQERLRQGADHLPVVCPSLSGPLVGGSAVITDTSGERRSTATLTYLVPLLSPTDGSLQQSGLRDLVDRLVFEGNGAPARQSQLRTVQPPLWTGAGRPLQVREMPRKIPERGVAGPGWPGNWRAAPIPGAAHALDAPAATAAAGEDSP